MTGKGRYLEKFVELLEKFDVEGATITSPDHIIDKVTNVPREVDISVKFQKGSHNFLIVLECRDRKTKGGVEWIEQITQKTRDIGANKVIAVSTSGFTKGAIEKAKFKNIECRTLKEVTPEEFGSWLLTREIMCYTKKVNFLEINVV
ncbi:MAG: restriction endonuclease [Methanoregula sp.]|jgi:hypothetical protein|uniref:restriction endonuclease n=1 Tax=Methanoregula sp. TaxID=2052170 RepID=UPI003C288C0A